MKKYIFIAVALLSMAVCSCKKESKTDPTPTPQDPVVTNDSLNIKIRIYATIEQMQYVNYKVFFTPNGEAEKELQLTKTVELDTKIDKLLSSYINTSEFDKDSVLIYNFDMKVKEGTQFIRFEGSLKDTVMPEIIHNIHGYCFAVKGKGSDYDVPVQSVHYGYAEPTELDAMYKSQVFKRPITINLYD